MLSPESHLSDFSKIRFSEFLSGHLTRRFLVKFWSKNRQLTNCKAKFGDFKIAKFALKKQHVRMSPILVKSGCQKSPTVGVNSTFFNTCLQLKLRASQRNCDFCRKVQIPLNLSPSNLSYNWRQSRQLYDRNRL